MFEQGIGALTLRDVVPSIYILPSFLVLAALVFFFFNRVARRIKTSPLRDMVLSLRKPLLAILIIAGFYLALAYLPLTEAAHRYTVRGGAIVLSLLGIYTVLAVLDALMRWYAREVAVKTKTGLDDRMIPVLRMGVPLVAAFLALFLGLELADIKASPVRTWLVEHGTRIALIFALSVAAVLVVGQVIPKLIASAVARGAPELGDEARKRAETLSRVLVAAAQVIVLMVAFFMVLSEVGLNIAPVLAGVGVVGIALGFGAQNLVRDILAGLFVILENQYRVGDVVRLADVSGLVEDINLRRTVLRDLDGIVHTIPNGEIRVASNFTREWSRVNLNVSVGYGEDLDHVIAVINRVGQELAQDPEWAPLILKAPQALRVDNLGDSGIEIKILGDTKPIRQWDVMGELRKRLKKAFDEEGIEIPWPHTKVYFGNWPLPGESGVSSMREGGPKTGGKER